MTVSDAHRESRARAIQRAIRAVDALESMGVSAVVTGSLARGLFRDGSDIDFLVVECPRPLKYAIEGIVEDHVDGAAFDVIYLDEVPLRKMPSFVDGAVRARDLR